MVQRSITPVNSYLAEQERYRAGLGKNDIHPMNVRIASGGSPVNSYLPEQKPPQVRRCRRWGYFSKFALDFTVLK